MTSLKGPSSEHGDTSPELDVLTGPPAEPAVAAEPAREAPEPPTESEPMPEPVPIAESAPAETPPPEDVTPPTQPPIATDPEPNDSAPMEASEIPDETAETLAIADDVPAEAVQPATAPEDHPPESDGTEPPPLAATLVAAETVDPEAADTAPLAAADPAVAPAPEPKPLPEIAALPPASEILAPILAPAMVSAIPAPSPVALDPPTQPAPAPPLLPPVPPIATTPAKPARASWRVWLRRAVLASIGLATGYAALVLVLIGVYRYVDPPLSTVMLGLMLTGQSVDRELVPITSISSYLQRAVITSEDARFCRHGGVDWGALAEAMQDSRGGSTITMQVAKNLFLWPSRSYVRKAIEIPVALMIDFAWPKRRILEIYLNIAEWGPSVFGAEAAAQYHFGKAASRLTLHEATLLAAALPNPIAREAGDPGRVTALLASRLRGRVANSDAYVSCLGLRPMPRPEPDPRQKPATATKPAPKAEPWQTRTEPAKPPTRFNPWQN